MRDWGHDGRQLEQVARQQGGVVTRRQAHAAGLTDAAIKARLHAKRWQPLFAGTYAIYVGKITQHSRLWAAVLHAGNEAVLSHESAGEVCGLIDEPAARIHITVDRDRHLPPRRGLVIHRSSRVRQARHPGRIPPQTRVEETVIDLTQRERSIGGAVGWLTRACERRLTTGSRLREALSLRKRLRWRQELSEAVSDVELGCHSVLEWLYLRRVERAHGLPTGRRQAPGLTPAWSGNGVRRRYDDVLYEAWAVIVELDGRATHTDRTRLHDRHRDNDLVARGARVLRYGWGDVAERPCAVAAQVGHALRQGGWQGAVRSCGPSCTIH